MKIIQQEVPDNFNLFCITDDHEGNLLRHTDGWNQMIDMVRSGYDGLPPDKNFVVDHGDICEGIAIDDKRYDGITTQGAIYSQKQQCVTNRSSIIDNLVVILDGNHPWKHWKFFGQNKPGFTEVVCNELDVKYGTWSCVIEYISSRNGDLMFKQYAAHVGGKSAPSSMAGVPRRRQTNMEAGLQDRLQGKMADTILMTCGHWHKMIYAKPTTEFYITSENGRLISGYSGQPVSVGRRIHPDHRHYICCGSFLKTYGDDVSGYAERFGLDPVELGFYVVRIRDRVIVNVDKIPLN